MGKVIDMTGARYGRWTVIDFAGIVSNGAGWNCECECGTQRVVPRLGLMRGTSKSCGCLQKELAKAKHTTHGLTKGRTYIAWASMKQRCTNPNSQKAGRYLNRGIKICARWLNSFDNFLADMGECPKGLTLERRDNDGDYTPENCVWATKAQQNRNKSLPEKYGDKVPGVNWLRRDKVWRASIGKGTLLGHFKIYEDAVAARKAAELTHWTEDA